MRTPAPLNKAKGLVSHTCRQGPGAEVRVQRCRPWTREYTGQNEALGEAGFHGLDKIPLQRPKGHIQRWFCLLSGSETQMWGGPGRQ